MENDRFVTIRSYHDQIFAHLIQAALHDAGIETMSISTSDILPHSTYEIIVLQNDVELALEIIEQHENF